jgi:hypothetical protein
LANPAREGEYITVQIINRSVLNAEQAPAGTPAMNTSKNYHFEAPLVEESELDEISSSSGEDNGDLVFDQGRTDSVVSGVFDEGGYLYTQKRLIENVDENKGIINTEFARVAKSFENDVYSDKEIAVVGYWKQLPSNLFKCYHYFYIPTPMKRAIKDVSTSVLYLVLYLGRKNEIFFFYKQKDAVGNNSITIGILDQGIIKR